MSDRRSWLGCAAVVAAGAGGVLLLRSFGPLQWPTVLVYAGLVVALCGLAAVVRPPRFLGVRRRLDAAIAVLGGLAVVGLGLLWPANPQRGTGSARMDAFMPEYHFHELHELRVQAPPDRVMQAAHEVTFADIGVMQTLGRVRNAVMGSGNTGRAPAMPPKPILTLIASSATGFFPLEETEREYIFGLAGQPWNNSARPVRLRPKEFASWNTPYRVKVAANLRVEDAGGGWTRLSTETRVLATDDAARRTMARYWRFIYPGSGMIRKSLLEAIRLRAEAK